MPLGTDDDVVVHRDIEPLGGVDDAAGEVDVGAARLRVARGVVVDQPRRMR